jgi:hypothetical protein
MLDYQFEKKKQKASPSVDHSVEDNDKIRQQLIKRNKNKKKENRLLYK